MAEDPAALAGVEVPSRLPRKRRHLLNVPPPNSGKNAFDYCGHTGAAMTGCGVEDAGVTAPYPLCDAFWIITCGRTRSLAPSVCWRRRRHDLAD